MLFLDVGNLSTNDTEGNEKDEGERKYWTCLEMFGTKAIIHDVKSFGWFEAWAVNKVPIPNWMEIIV